MSLARKASYVLFAALVASAALLSLGPVLLAGLFSYMIIDLAHRRLAAGLRPVLARWLALAVFVVAAAAIGSIFIHFLRNSLSSLPRIAGTAIPKVLSMIEAYGFDLPFENVTEVREMLVGAVKDNALAITKATGLLTKGFFQVVVGIFVAVLCFLTDQPALRPEANLFEALCDELLARVRLFMLGFEKVFGAQVVISGINTLVTAIFLLVVGIPHAAFLVPATFILGILPLIGNVLSNTLIVSSALAISTQHAAMALAFLVIIHKVEYFLNSRIVGASIESPMWLTLIGILVGEILMGVPGIILAPAILHHIRAELQTLPPGPETAAPAPALAR